MGRLNGPGRCLAEHVIDAAGQRPLARSDCARSLIEREAIGQVVARPALEFLHERIGMREMIGQALMAKAPELFSSAPSIEPIEVLGSKGAA